MSEQAVMIDKLSGKILQRHKFPVGSLVELYNGVRMFVFMHTWDCDGSALYILTANEEYFEEMVWYYDRRPMQTVGGYGESDMKLIKPWPGEPIKDVEKFSDGYRSFH